MSALLNCVGVEALVVPEIRGGGAVKAARDGEEGGEFRVGSNGCQHGVSGDMVVRSHAINTQDRRPAVQLDGRAEGAHQGFCARFGAERVLVRHAGCLDDGGEPLGDGLGQRNPGSNGQRRSWEGEGRMATAGRKPAGGVPVRWWAWEAAHVAGVTGLAGAFLACPHFRTASLATVCGLACSAGAARLAGLVGRAGPGVRRIQSIVDFEAEACVKAMKNLGCLKDGADFKKVEAVVQNNFETGKVKSKRSKRRPATFVGGKRALTEEEKYQKTPKQTEVMKYFKLPPALAFVARAITQMEGVGVMLDEDASPMAQDYEFIDFVADKVPELQVERGAGISYIAGQLFKNWIRLCNDFTAAGGCSVESGRRLTTPELIRWRSTHLPRSGRLVAVPALADGQPPGDSKSDNKSENASGSSGSGSRTGGEAPELRQEARSSITRQSGTKDVGDSSSSGTTEQTATHSADPSLLSSRQQTTETGRKGPWTSDSRADWSAGCSGGYSGGNGSGNGSGNGGGNGSGNENGCGNGSGSGNTDWSVVPGDHNRGSSASSEFAVFNGVPGLDGVSSSSEDGSGEAGGQSSASIYGSLAAHNNGTCRPCRFFHFREGGCRLGYACDFCHYCTRERARIEKLRVKYADRRAARQRDRDARAARELMSTEVMSSSHAAHPEPSSEA
eukprot:s198_g30.t1